MAAPEELVTFSRIRLAQALKEDPKDPELVHKSALFIQLRNRQPQTLTQSQHNIPRPQFLIVPPTLGNSEYTVPSNNIVNENNNLLAANNGGANSKSYDPFRKSRIYSSPSLPSLPVSRQTPNHSPSGSVSSISSSPIPPAPPISYQPQPPPPNKQNALIGTEKHSGQQADVDSILFCEQSSNIEAFASEKLFRSPLSHANSSSSSLPLSLASTSNQSSSRPNSIFGQNRPNASPNLPRPTSSYSNMSRPLSVHSLGKANSRPPSIWGYVPPVDSSEESSEESSEGEEESGDEQESTSDAKNNSRIRNETTNKKTMKPASRASNLPMPPPLSQPKGYKPPSPTSSPTRTSPTRTSPTRTSPNRTSPTRTSPTRSSTRSPENGEDDVKVHTPTSMSILEKVEEEKSDEESDEESEEESDEEGSDEESEEESEEDSGEESSDSDTPLALRMDAPPRFSILSSSGKKSPRVEAWVSDVSRQSLVIDSRTFNPRKQRQSQVMGDSRPRKTSLTPDSVFDPRMRRPKSAYTMDESDFLPPQPQYRKRSNSEFAPGSSSQYRPISMYSAARASPPLLLSTPVQLPKADNDDWAQDTLLALSTKVPSSTSPIPPPQKHRVVRSSASMTNLRAGTPPLSLPAPPRSPGEFYIHHSRKQNGSNSSLNKLVLNGEGRRERGDRDRMDKRARERSYSASSQQPLQQQGRKRDHSGLGYGPVGTPSQAINRISMYGGAAHRRVASDHISKGDNMMYYRQRKDLQT
ncbi:10268_t:CDS:2 [Paraglomus brasilianum]|uniref:10268_t:CDS:1 n=1 Tax=Paraglomus brasilianum TaxID=144538 RepID=A0A9N9BA74_9GLOM|nr:10268_t:CDS:2 [Paraglomus brasilianum]